MGWGLIGTINPSTYWQFFNAPVNTETLFRVSQNWVIQPWGKLWIAQSFTQDLHLYQIKRLYIDSQINLYELLLPVAFENTTILSRKIGLKTNLYEPNWEWEITIEGYSYSENDTI